MYAKANLHPKDFHLYTYRNENKPYNAIFSGTNRIAVSEDMLSDCFEKVCSVVAHEISHLKDEWPTTSMYPSESNDSVSWKQRKASRITFYSDHSPKKSVLP